MRGARRRRTFCLLFRIDDKGEFLFEVGPAGYFSVEMDLPLDAAHVSGARGGAVVRNGEGGGFLLDFDVVFCGEQCFFVERGFDDACAAVFSAAAGFCCDFQAFQGDGQLVDSLGIAVDGPAQGDCGARVGVSRGVEVFREEQERVDLVLLDMIMPTMNGLDCFRALRQLSPSVPIIIASGFSQEKDLQELKELGLSGFIHKPYRSSELGEAIMRVLAPAE